MATTIVTKNGSGAPTDSDLVAGELAVDLTNGRLYTTDLDSGGTVLELGTNPASDVTFGDNTKAIFGAGSDLQIYHDASDSIINDNGTGSLKLQQGGSTKLEVTATGVDVTGSVTADGLTVDTDTLVVDATNNRVGIGTDSPDTLLHLEGADGVPQLKFLRAGTVIGGIIRQTSNPYGLTYDAIDGNAGAPTHVFRTSVDGSTFTERMRIDASGNVGIGISPQSFTDLMVKTATDRNVSIFDNATGATVSGLTDAGASAALRLAGFPLIFTGNGGSGSEAMRIDSSGNVGIGVVPSAWWTGFEALQLGESAALTGRNGGVEQCNLTSNAVFDLTDVRYEYVMGASNEATLYQQTDGTHRFNTAPAGTAGNPIPFTESMRIDASGNLLVGMTSDNYLAADDGVQIKPEGNIRIGGAGTGARSVMAFVNDTAGTPAQVGSIQTSGSATTYATSSDQRLKDNIVDAPSASDDIDAIQVRSFDWKVDGSHQKYGMVAQELQSVAPEAVSATEDPEEMMGVDYSKLVPMLVKEIQSLRARVAQLES